MYIYIYQYCNVYVVENAYIYMHYIQSCTYYVDTHVYIYMKGVD